MKPLSSLEDRIRSVRQGFRAGQPLDYRIKLVRERHQAAKKKSVRRMQVNPNRKA